MFKFITGMRYEKIFVVGLNLDNKNCQISNE